MNEAIDYEATIYPKNGEIIVDCITAKSKQEAETILYEMYSGIDFIEF